MRRGVGLIIPVLLLLLWELLGRVGAIPVDAVSTPSAIAAAWAHSLVDGSLLLATWQTFETALAGLALATIIGVLAGVALGLMPVLEQVTGPTIEALRPIPAIAFMPLALMMFGFGVALEASIVTYACVWPILIVTIGAVRAIEPRLLEVAAVLEMPLTDRLRKIVLPAALARINVGVRIAAAIALVVAVTVEIVLNPRGLGYHLILAQQSMQVALMYAQLFWLCVIGLLLNILLRNMGGPVRGWGAAAS
ncbi:MAG TPA: ABC transporter permease subunit [Pseudolabrys sp.]|nr:ABC transporter permease subunit [Pseudolabrys sp.]